MTLFRKGACLLALASTPILATTPQAFAGGDIHVDARLRYETVEQPGKLDADAFTLRTRLGWTSPERNGLRLLAEVENIIDLGGDRNTGLNGQTAFATIKDDDNTELQRLQIDWAASENWSFRIGRQHLSFDNSRFIGSPGWGQDKTSHDAALARFSFGDFTASYAYHWRINRGLGQDFDWETDTHLFHLAVRPSENVTVTGFAYLIDLDDPSAPQDRSNATFGARLDGSADMGGYTLGYNAMVATQSDYGSSSVDYNLGYLGGEVNLARDGWRVRAGAEWLEGDGTRAVSNPLSANHGTAGWADAIHGGGAMAPGDGVSLVYIGGSYGQDVENAFIRSFALGFTAWEFEFDRTGLELGDELDLFARFGITDAVDFHIQYADYDGVEANNAPTDRTKTWVFFTYRR
ncbi:MAG: alginate export family protein [Alphaproteobacteria bacterium]|nr:alginate export family protein [Alphaproteobacteria bacterium]